MPELDRTRNSLSQPRSIFPRKFFFQTFVFSLSSVAILNSPSPSLVFRRWGLVWSTRNVSTSGVYVYIGPHTSDLMQSKQPWLQYSEGMELHFLSTITLQHNTDANLECPEHKIPSLFCRLWDIWSSLKQQTKIHNFENIQRTFESLHPLQSRREK